MSGMDAVYHSRRLRMVRRSLDKRLCLSGRDVAIFRLLDRYRYLRSTFICAFFPEADRTGLVKRLGDLFHEGYLDRPEGQYDYANALYLPAVYALNDRSEAVLREQGKGERSVLVERGRMGAHRHFAHALMISDILASIELGVRQAGLRFISAAEIVDKGPCRNLENPFRVRTSVSLGGSSRTDVAVVPDGLFGLEYGGANGKSYRFFALEADRNTMPVRRRALRRSSYVRKLLAYREILAHGLHRSHFDVPNLFILNVTVNDTHRRNIMRVLQEITNGKGSTMFLFKTMSALGDGLKAPEPSPHMLLEPWEREGHEPFNIGGAG